MKKIFLLMCLSLLTLTSGAAFAQSKPVAKENASKVKMKKSKKAAKRKAVYKGKGSRAKARFAKMDTNSNGFISKAEFNKYHAAHFAKKDKNKDGKLSAGELSPVLAKKNKAKK